MPIPREQHDTPELRLYGEAHQRYCHHQGQKTQPHDYVAGMQPHERVESSSEQVGTDRQMVFIDQLPPFDRSCH